jgi:hypothetical protein
LCDRIPNLYQPEILSNLRDTIAARLMKGTLPKYIYLKLQVLARIIHYKASWMIAY